MMNPPNQPNRLRSGFTLVELLVVMAIIAALAAIAFTAVGYMTRLAYLKKAEAQLAALENGLQEYKGDHGVFPESLYAKRDEGAGVLYQALSGNGDSLLDGSSSPEAEPRTSDLVGRPIIPELLPGNQGEQKWVDENGPEPFFILDPWGETWYYVSGDISEQHNNEYDLWSTGPEASDNEDKWITNWR